MNEGTLFGRDLALLYLDYGATLLAAASGALAAGRRGYDLSGILAIALVAATGGGLLRDGIFLQGAPPVLVRTPTYLVVVVVAVGLVLLAGRWLHRARVFEQATELADALGLGAYAVVGMQLAATKGMSVLGITLVGVVNAVGGGLLRDVLMRQEPILFRPGTLLGLAALAGCLAHVAMTGPLQWPPGLAAWLTIALTFAVRMTSVRLNLTTRPVRALVEPPPGP